MTHHVVRLDEPAEPGAEGDGTQLAPEAPYADAACSPKLQPIAITFQLLSDLLAHLEKQIGPAEASQIAMLPAVPKAIGVPSSSLREAVSQFGLRAKQKLSNPAITGQPEDQLRTPVELLIQDLGRLCRAADLSVVGESQLSDLKSRPDFAVTHESLLAGFVELKAPGKGADPRRFRERHDKDQWDRLRALPNLIYTDGNAFSLWRNGELAGEIVQLSGDVEMSGAALVAPPSLLTLFSDFLSWEPSQPRDAKQLAETTARLCRLLRDEVTEQLAVNNRTLAALHEDWRKILFPNASDMEFADGYAQAVTFGMLMARAQNISLANGLDQAAKQLGPTLIGTALSVLTFGGRMHLPTSIRTLERVLDVVDWSRIGKSNPEAWLYFYEDFLAAYDAKLRKRTGSYYTPPQVVSEMVRLVDELLRTRFDLSDGLASSTVTLVDPAVGTGTFLLGVLRKIATTVEADQGPGAVAAAIEVAAQRLIAFEIQLGPFAVAQLRLLAELTSLIGRPPTTSPRMFVTDTLANPYVEQEWLPQMLEPIAESRRQANQIKKQERVMVVLGNPPYGEHAKGRGSWVEEGDTNEDGTKKTVPPLDAWIPPTSWRVGAHAKHLRNLYVYFWRWATWKVFDQDPVQNNGVVCFISVAGFLNGPGFQRMREYLRRTTDEIWVIDCSPEGHQPSVSTRIFEGVQQPICIVVACRSPRTDATVPAKVRFRALGAGDHRAKKFEALASIGLDRDGWVDCPTGWREPFLPASTGAWSTYLRLEDFFVYHGSGVMPGRTWVIAPDADSLVKRWQALVDAPIEKKEDLFHPHLQGDKTATKRGTKGLPGHEARLQPVAADHGACVVPVRYGFRSFDRQWIIPDNRLINRPNPELWSTHSSRQVYLTALMQHSPSGGPAITVTGLIPDLHHYKGSFGGRTFPLWRDREGSQPNIRAALLARLAERYETPVSAEDLVAYIAAVAAHPAFVSLFSGELVQPGLRIPVTADVALFKEAVELGRIVIWLHSFGERYSDPAGRPAQPPRLARSAAPRIQKGGEITGEMPNELRYEATEQRLYVGSGYVDNVTAEMWGYEVSGTQVLLHWFSYRKADRERPIIGERRTPSPLGFLQPDHWPAEYTTELMNLLNVLGLLSQIEPQQAVLLARIVDGDTIAAAELAEAAPSAPPPQRKTRGPRPGQIALPLATAPKHNRKR